MKDKIVFWGTNESDAEIDYMLTIDKKTATLKMPARSIQSIILN